MSPRLLSICFNSDIGKVIPSFSVLSASVVLTIPIYLIILSYKRFLYEGIESPNGHNGSAMVGNTIILLHNSQRLLNS
jgi:hypothetical protein